MSFLSKLSNFTNRANNICQGLTDLNQVIDDTKGQESRLQDDVGVTFHRGRKFKIKHKDFKISKSLDGLYKETSKLSIKTAKHLNAHTARAKKASTAKKSKDLCVLLNDNQINVFIKSLTTSHNLVKSFNLINKLEQHDKEIEVPVVGKKASFGLRVRRYFGNFLHSHDFFEHKSNKNIKKQIEATINLGNEFIREIDVALTNPGDARIKNWKTPEQLNDFKKIIQERLRPLHIVAP